MEPTSIPDNVKNAKREPPYASLVTLGIVLLASCSGGGGLSGTTPQQHNVAPAPAASSAAAGKKVPVLVAIHVPGPSSMSKSKSSAVRQGSAIRTPKYLGSTSVADTLTFTPSDSAGVATSGGTVITVSIGTACSPATVGVLCSVPLIIATYNTPYYWVVQAYDQAADVNLVEPLSWGVLSVTITPNTAYTSSVHLLPVLGSIALSSSAANVSLGNSSSLPLTITPLDELGNAIVDTAVTLNNGGPDTFIDAAGNPAPITVTGTGSGVMLRGVDASTLGVSFPDASTSSSTDDLSINSVADVFYDGTTGSAGVPIVVGFTALGVVSNYALTVFAGTLTITPQNPNPADSLAGTVVLNGNNTGQTVVTSATFTATSPNTGATLTESDNCATAALLGGGPVATVTPTGSGIASGATFTVTQVTGGTCLINLSDSALSPAGASVTVDSTTSTVAAAAKRGD
jgi:hypothetical protein